MKNTQIKLKNLALFMFAGIFLFTSCTEAEIVNKEIEVNEGEQIVEYTMNDLQVSSDFDFSTKSTVNVELTTKRTNGELVGNVYVEVFHNKSNRPIYKGITNEMGYLLATVNLATQVEQLVVVPQTHGFYEPVIIKLNGQENIAAKASAFSTKATSKKNGTGCNIEAGQFRTQTQGGWGTSAKGNNPGTYRDANFGNAFPNGLTVGSVHTLHLSNSAAVEAFLPQGGKPATLTSSLTNPKGKVSVLAGQIVALTLSVHFDEADPNFGASSTALGDLEIASGTFQGWTVYELLAEANVAFGGGVSQYSLSAINDALSSINENFVDGTMTGNFLTCPNGVEPDQDGDGVPDTHDDYPDDPNKAFNNITDGTLVWEDLWPNKGDFDFNDLVTDYTYNLISNANNLVAELEMDFEVRAIGAGFHNGLAVSLDIAPSLIQSVSGQHLSGAYAQVAANGTEIGQTNAVIMIFENAFHILPHPGSGHRFVNTYPDEPHFDPKSTNTIRVTFTEPLASSTLGELPFNPFLIRNQDRSYEIHLPDLANSALADISLFGTGNDTSDPSTDRYYRTENHMPWALHLPAGFEYPIEKTDINSAYLKFKDWAESNGQLFKDWYEDKPGYRVSNHIYQ